MNQKPVWLLDIDGVINAVPNVVNRNPYTLSDPPTWAWPEKTWTRKTVNKMPITIASAVIDYIIDVHDSGFAEIRWHTTWQNDAQMVADAFGLPEFPVAEAPEFEDSSGFGQWWKFPAALRVLEVENRPLLWTDDDITIALRRSDLELLAGNADANLVIPDTASGLNRSNIHNIDTFLNRYI